MGSLQEIAEAVGSNIITTSVPAYDANGDRVFLEPVIEMVDVFEIGEIFQFGIQ